MLSDTRTISEENIQDQGQCPQGRGPLRAAPRLALELSGKPVRCSGFISALDGVLAETSPNRNGTDSIQPRRQMFQSKTKGSGAAAGTAPGWKVQSRQGLCPRGRSCYAHVPPVTQFVSRGIRAKTLVSLWHSEDDFDPGFS